MNGEGHLFEALLYFNQAVCCEDSPPFDHADAARGTLP